MNAFGSNLEGLRSALNGITCASVRKQVQDKIDKIVELIDVLLCSQMPLQPCSVALPTCTHSCTCAFGQTTWSTQTCPPSRIALFLPWRP